MSQTENYYQVEITDTFGGEANYSWVRRYKVKAKSRRSALIKISKETGLKFRHYYDIPDENFTQRYNAKGACICMFIGNMYTENSDDYEREEI